MKYFPSIERIRGSSAAVSLTPAERTPLIRRVAFSLGAEWQFWVVLALALAVMTIVQQNVSFWFGSSDHDDYYWYARFLAGKTYAGLHLPSNWRTPGMGLFYILTGTLRFDTWKVFIAFFWLSSAAIPVLTYLVVARHSRNFALLAAVMMIASMIPYTFASKAGDDQLFYFLLALFLCLAVAYFDRESTRTLGLLIAITLVSAYAQLVRPVGAMLFWIFIVVALFFRFRDRRHLVTAGAVYILLMGLWAVWDRNDGSNGGASPGIFYPIPTQLQTIPERRFAEAYYSADSLTHAKSDSAAQGYPESTKLRATLKTFLTQHPEAWQTAGQFTPEEYFGKYSKDPHGADLLLDAFFDEPNTLYLGFIFRGIETSLPGRMGRDLINGVAHEHGTSGFYGWLHYFASRPLLLLFGVIPNLSGRMLFASWYLNMSLEGYCGAHPTSFCEYEPSVKPIPSDLVSANSGPAASQIAEIITRFIAAYPEYWPENLRKKYSGQPKAAAAAVLTPGAEGYGSEGFVYQIVDWYLGGSGADRLFRDAALQILYRHPRLALIKYDLFLDLTVARPTFEDLSNPITFDSLGRSSDAYFEKVDQVRANLTPGLSRELGPTARTTELGRMVYSMQMLVYAIAPLFVYLLLAALPFMRGPATTAPCLFLILVYLYQVASIAMFSVWGAVRYESNFYLLPLIISCIIFGQLSSDLYRRRRAKVPEVHRG